MTRIHRTLTAFLLSFFGVSAFAQSPSLQSLINGDRVKIPAGIYTLTEPLRLRSNLTLEFEPGTLVQAAAGAFKGKADCLVVAEGVQNLSIVAEGVVFRMRKADYLGPWDKPGETNAQGYAKSEDRHVLSLLACVNCTITGGTFADSGGDGIFIGSTIVDDVGFANNKKHTPCENVIIRRANCDNNFRQGISVVAAKGKPGEAGYFGATIEDCVLTKTAGTSPQSGIDVEPEYTDPIDVAIRRCRSEGNRGPAYVWSLQNMALGYRAPAGTAAMPPVRLVMEGCTAAGVPIDQPVIRMRGIFAGEEQSATAKGYLYDNIPKGSLLKLDVWEWKK